MPPTADREPCETLWQLRTSYRLEREKDDLARDVAKPRMVAWYGTRKNEISGRYRIGQLELLTFRRITQPGDLKPAIKRVSEQNPSSEQEHSAKKPKLRNSRRQIFGIDPAFFE